jgi:hypothetical protein
MKILRNQFCFLQFSLPLTGMVINFEGYLFLKQCLISIDLLLSEKLHSQFCFSIFS